jgi:beta-lactamase regulating signal transducer with metallopeptidase domain
MELLFAYLIKLACCLALGYLFYFLLLRRITYYNWNRYFLLFFPLAALVLPLLPLQLPHSVQTFKAAYFITDILPATNAVAATNNQLQSVSTWNLYKIALLLILAGMIFFLLRFIIRICSLYTTRKVAKLVNDGEVKLYHLENCSSPFSFYNSIYLNTNLYRSQELEKILEHELVHVTQKHTLDMLVAEMLCIIQWFNPFVWFMKHAIKQNLEFIADDQVLQKGINRAGYQYLLLKVSGAMPHSIANNLLFPSLKKRIQMMNREKTGKMHLLKFVCIVPLGFVLLFSFSGTVSEPAIRNSSANVSETFNLSSLSFYINDENAAAIIKKEQEKSFLKAGGALSLAMISDEKARLKNLLEKNGYDNLSGHAITFIMDTSATSHSFSVQVTIHLDKDQKTLHQLNKNPAGISTANPVTTTETKYIIAPDETAHEKMSASQSLQISRSPGASDKTIAMK